MALKSVLKPDSSVMAGLAEAAAVYTIYASSLPNQADIRSAKANNPDVEAVRRGAAWKSAAVLGFVFLLTQDLNSFLIGGLALGGIDYLYKHSNGINPATGKLDSGGATITSSSPAPAAGSGNSQAFPLADYSGAGTGYPS